MESTIKPISMQYGIRFTVCSKREHTQILNTRIIDPFPDVKAYADATSLVVTIYGEKGVTQVLVVTIYG